jgi:ribosome-associated toxin RatA of RatAB toxin-antitoxin module
MKRITRSAIVDCTADAFYALVEDIEAYPSFLPWCAAAHVRERTPERTVATLTLAAKGLRQSFTTENANQPGRAIDMRLLEGPFKRFEAHWRFRQLSPEATKVEFSLAYEFSSRLVATLLDPVFNRLADGTVAAFVRRLAAHTNG